jgi:hypothetical protein
MKPVEAWWREVRGNAGQPKKPRRSTRRPIYLEGSDTCPPLGEPTTQWIVDHVLNGPPRPVPSYGFDLVPVLTHTLRARRRRLGRRGCLLSLIALAAYMVPPVAAIWGGAVLIALIMRWAAFRAARKGRKSRLARSPRLAYTVLFVPWILAIVPLATELRLGLILLPWALLIAAAVVCGGDRLAARAALAALVAEGVSSDRLPWLAPKARRRASELGKDQVQLELPYDSLERFVGAGRDVWGPAHINIPLKPKDPGESVRLFRDGDLLRRVGRDLSALGRGAREVTDPLPGFSVAEVVGMPSAMWLSRTRQSGVELDLPGWGRRSPSSRPDRPYLRAQCISWGGQVVVSVFVHAALEAGELRLTVRPHVMTPLYNELRVATAPVSKRRLRLLGWLTVQSLLDAVTGPVALWRLAARLGDKAEGRAEEEDPVSLRDRYSTEEVTDMHQSDDARRHVVLMQSCVFRTVDTYLGELGVDTAAYEGQVAMVMNNIQVFGDNNAPIQSVAGSGISDVGQHSQAQGGK